MSGNAYTHRRCLFTPRIPNKLEREAIYKYELGDTLKSLRAMCQDEEEAKELIKFIKACEWVIQPGTHRDKRFSRAQAEPNSIIYKKQFLFENPIVLKRLADIVITRVPNTAVYMHITPDGYYAYIGKTTSAEARFGDGWDTYFSKIMKQALNDYGGFSYSDWEHWVFLRTGWARYDKEVDIYDWTPEEAMWLERHFIVEYETCKLGLNSNTPIVPWPTPTEIMRSLELDEWSAYELYDARGELCELYSQYRPVTEVYINGGLGSLDNTYCSNPGYALRYDAMRRCGLDYNKAQAIAQDEELYRRFFELTEGWPSSFDLDFVNKEVEVLLNEYRGNHNE